MKRFSFVGLGRTLLMLTAVLAFGLLGCGGDDNSNNNGGNTTHANECGKDGTAASCKSKLMPDGKTWITENLNRTTDSSWCYGKSPDSCAKYGRLYTWEAAKTACPSGWSLPTRQEWNDLVTAAGGEDAAGANLKSKSGWNSYNGTDQYEFSALPGGVRSSNGGFSGIGGYGGWWTATEDVSGYMSGYARRMYDRSNVVTEGNEPKSYGYSVRCVK